MRVLVQKTDRYGQRPIKAGMAFLNDGPDTFKGEGNKPDLELIKHCLDEGLGINDEEELDFIVNGDDPVVMSKDGSSVHISMEEVDYILVNIDPFLED